MYVYSDRMAAYTYSTCTYVRIRCATQASARSSALSSYKLFYYRKKMNWGNNGVLNLSLELCGFDFLLFFIEKTQIPVGGRVGGDDLSWGGVRPPVATPLPVNFVITC